jgi:hypothetical protein
MLNMSGKKASKEKRGTMSLGQFAQFAHTFFPQFLEYGIPHHILHARP